MSGEITHEDLDHFERTLEALALELKIGDAEMFNLLAIHGACVTAAVDKEREACAAMLDAKVRDYKLQRNPVLVGYCQMFARMIRDRTD